MADQINSLYDSLRVQLAELNARARAYTKQSWQVPFAYLGIIGVLLVQLAEKKTETLATTAIFIAGAIFGIAVIIHIAAMLEGVSRAVTNIQKVEHQLGLEQTAEYKPVWHIGPLIFVVLLVVIYCSIAGGYFLCKAIGVISAA